MKKILCAAALACAVNINSFGQDKDSLTDVSVDNENSQDPYFCLQTTVEASEKEVEGLYDRGYEGLHVFFFPKELKLYYQAMYPYKNETNKDVMWLYGRFLLDDPRGDGYSDNKPDSLTTFLFDTQRGMIIRAEICDPEKAKIEYEKFMLECKKDTAINKRNYDDLSLCYDELYVQLKPGLHVAKL